MAMIIETKLVNEGFIPKRVHKMDVGYDLRSAEELNLYVGETRAVKTGVSVHMPGCVMGTVRGRSGLATKGIFAHVGTIDSGYQGEIAVILHNTSQAAFKIEKGDRIGQLIFSTVLTPEFKIIEEFSAKSDRGTNGFGSTGTV